MRAVKRSLTRLQVRDERLVGGLAPKRSAEAPPEVTDTDDGVRITGPGVQMF
jgi:hypothetical protein